MQLEEFNAMDATGAASIATVWAAIPRWADALVAERPYADLDELVTRADSLAAGWTRADLDEALAHHPRIGERPTGQGAEADASRSEQSSMTDAATAVTAQIAAGNAAYEERFGRVFLIRAAGRSPEEMLAELQRRLGNSDDAEAVEATRQLAEIAMLRLRAAVTEG
jgi:2-oxo-4-hydroxy-4-carboxy-5-ureidoimidazoline decarboxylase